MSDSFDRLQRLLEAEDKVFGSFNRLRRCLEIYDENGREGHSGPWSIGRGGYDLDWELYYRGEPVMDCVRSEVEIIDERYKGWEKVIEIVKEAQPYCKYRLVNRWLAGEEVDWDND